MPKLSIVIPSYNNADFIEDTMRSVLEQDFRDFELIVSDHSSRDDTLARLTPFADDPRVRVFTTPAGGGAPRNWSAVTAAASGEYLKLVCGDDVLRPGVLAAQVRTLDEQPGAVLTASRRDIVDAKGALLIRGRGLTGIDRLMPGTEAVRRAVRAGTNLFGEPACVMMRRADLEAIGGWDGRFPYLIDQTTYSRVLFRGDFAPTPGIGAAFRLNSGQWSVALARSQAEQAAAMHAALRAERPESIGAVDVRLGDLRARLMAQARRAVYLRYRSRM